MTTDVLHRPLRSATVTIALLSAAMLAFQLLLGRVCTVRLHESFGLRIVGTSLLGIGAAGAVLTMLERSWRLLPELWVRRASMLFLVSLPLSWAYLLSAPVPASLQFDSAGAMLQLLGFHVAGAVPFCFGGAAVGVLVAANMRGVHAVYGSKLLGAAIACALCPVVLWHVGAGGCFLATVVLAAAAASASAPMDVVPRTVLLLVAALGGFWMHGFDAAFPVPGRPDSNVAAADDGALPAPAVGEPLYTRWSGNARVELSPMANVAIVTPPAQPAGDSLPAPRQWWLADGADSGSVLRDFGTVPAAAERLRQTFRSLALHLRSGIGARVCVLGIGGGADLWAACVSDAAHIRAIEGDPAVLEVHRTVARQWSAPLLDDPRIDIVRDDPRSALMRSDQRFDVIQCTDGDTASRSEAGARALEQNYLFTVEACRTMFDRLTDTGILQITRPADAPATIRLLNNIFHALPEVGREQFAASVAVLQAAAGDRISVLVRKGGFLADETAQLREFAAAGGMAAVVLPGGDLREVVENRLAAITSVEQQIDGIDREIAVRTEGVDDKELRRLRAERTATLAPLPRMRSEFDVATFVQAIDKDAFAEDYAFDVRPTTDDRPFFHRLGAGADVGAAFVQRQFAFLLLAAALFVLLPLLFRGGAITGSRRGALRFACYFGALAIGGVGLEAGLMQKFALLLGEPVLSTTITLASLLLFGAVGSMLSHGFLNWEPQRGRLVAIGLFAGAGLAAFLGQMIVDLCIGLALPWRAAAVAVVTAPIGLLLGMTLPHGLRIVERVNPSLVPWAWTVAASGAAVGGLLVVVLSVNFGFAAVLFAAGLLFLFAFGSIDVLARATDAAPEGEFDGEGNVDFAGAEAGEAFLES